MFEIRKRLSIAAAHRLLLDHESPCANLHGHNWTITVCCRSEKLDANGMVVDFSEIKSRVHGVLDHANLNEVLPGGMNPTAENLAWWVVQTVPNAYRCEVEETPGNLAVYELP